MIITCAGCNYNKPDVKEIETPVIISEVPAQNIEQETNEKKDPLQGDNSNDNTSDSSIVNYTDYIVNLEIDPNKRIVTGIEKIKYYNTTGVALNNLYINFYLNAFRRDNDYSPFFSSYTDNVFKYGKDYSVVNITGVAVNNEDVTFELNDIILSIDLKEPLMPRDALEITLQFDCYIPKICHRTGANDKAIWFGNFIPTIAVYDQYGWNLGKYYPAGDPFYSQIANYTVIIETPKDYKVISTSEGSVVEKDNKNITTINSKMVRDFAFAVGNQYLNDSIVTDDGITINFYHYSNIKNISEYLDTAKKSVEYYSNLIGSYPYQYLNIIECELFFQGGMEYPKFIMMDQQYLSNKKAIASLTHEIGHQWFYNIIGNNQITESWIDEGLTMLVQQKILLSDEEIESQMIEDYNALARNFESKLQDDHNYNNTLTASVEDFKTWRSYYDVFYTRGKLMIYSLQKKMGHEKFSEFLKVYYKKYAFKEINTLEFIKTAEEVYGNDLEDFFNRWIFDSTLPEL